MAGSWDSCVLLLLVLIATMASLHSVHAVVPAIYILGDSTADVGTNNHFNDTNTMAKADFPFNGIDFLNARATGRFSNGFNSADYLSKLMGFRRSPSPFLDLIERRSRLRYIMRGANFASGGSGILDNTGKPFGTVVSLSDQIKQFTTVRQQIEGQMGENATNSFLSKSIIFVSVGSNDIFENVFFNVTSDKQAFTAMLTSKYENHLRLLYQLGARKFGIISVPPIGCCPSQRVQNPTGECLEDLNEYSRMFFSAVEAVLQRLSSEFKDMKYSLGNTYEMVMNFMENPLPFKIKELQSACCGTGKFNGQGQCTPNANVCLNRDEYLFWDLYHPTQAAAELAALTLYGGAPRFVTPVNFKQLEDL